MPSRSRIRKRGRSKRSTACLQPLYSRFSLANTELHTEFLVKCRKRRLRKWRQIASRHNKKKSLRRPSKSVTRYWRPIAAATGLIGIRCAFGFALSVVLCIHAVARAHPSIQQPCPVLLPANTHHQILSMAPANYIPSKGVCSRQPEKILDTSLADTPG